MMLGVSALLAATILVGRITWFIGIIFLVSFVVYMIYVLKVASKERKNNIQLNLGRDNNIKKYILFVIFGLLSVIIGAKLLVDSSVAIAHALSVPTVVIALSVVSIGTSLPELAVSLLSAKKKEFEISVGNVVGSNIFNILFIIGLSSVITPIQIDIKSMFSILFLLVISLILIPILYTGYKISKIEGALLLILYVSYLSCLYIM